MKNILIIQTGGTVAMDINAEGKREISKHSANDTITRKIPELNDIAEIDIKSPYHKGSFDVGIPQWQKLIEIIAGQYRNYDGFVILHGTDTMAYTASALSFGLQNLGKPVILTGSQVPTAAIRSDGRRNIINAVKAATLPLPEVAICFNDRVYRGNRSTKMHISNFDAFESPNYPPLAKFGMNIDFKQPDPLPGQELKFTPEFADQIFLLKIYPNFNTGILDQFHFSEVKALVIEGFGSGNFPISGEQSLLSFFKQTTGRDIPLIVNSQAPYDAVDLSNYESGRRALDLGAVGAGDMTTEATLTKVMHLLGTGHTGDDLKERVQQNLAGELTVNGE